MRGSLEERESTTVQVMEMKGMEESTTLYLVQQATRNKNGRKQNTNLQIDHQIIYCSSSSTLPKVKRANITTKSS